jgi:ATP-binding cassette subfamily B protein
VNLEVTVRWRSPGRIRFDVPALRSNWGLARAVEDAIAHISGVSAAKAAPTTGSLVISFPPGLVSTDIEARVLSVLAEVADERLPERKDAPMVRILRISLPPGSDRVAPVLLSATAQSLNLLQGVSIMSMVNVAAGEPVALLTRLGVTTTTGQVAALGAAGIAMALSEAWVQHSRYQAWQSMARGAEDRLRVEVFEHLEHQDVQFFLTEGRGPLQLVLTEQIQSIGALIEGLGGLIESTVTVVAAGIALTRASPTVALIAGVALPLIIIPARLLGPRAARDFARRGEASARLAQALENIVGGIVEVKSFTAEEEELARVAKLSDRLARSSVEAKSSAFLQATISRNILFGTSAIGSWFAARMAQKKQLLPAQVTRVVFWIPRLFGAFSTTVGSSDVYFGARSSAEGLTRILDAVPAVVGGPLEVAPADLRGDIELDRVTFGYDPSRPVLHDISLQIRAGQTLGIVGRSGSGKSTLVRLLLRFFDPSSGVIRIAGHDIRQISLHDLRAAISLASQDIYLFDDSLGHNLRYGNRDATDHDLQRSLEQAGAGDLLELLPEGASTRIGERGQRLSGGQRQRVTLARALLKAAPILIADEATSQLDYETEAIVRSSLKAAAPERTVIVVAHRLTSVRDADTIIVLDEGRIVERGSHQELLQLGGLYHRLWQLQT